MGGDEDLLSIVGDDYIASMDISRPQMLDITAQGAEMSEAMRESPSKRNTPLSPSLVVSLPRVTFESPSVHLAAAKDQSVGRARLAGSPMGSSPAKLQHDFGGMVLPQVVPSPQLPSAKMQRRALHAHGINRADLEWLVQSPLQKHNRQQTRSSRQSAKSPQRRRQ
jgi:hypothetical protein